MLFALTSAIEFVSMAVSLWLALYLLGRGFPSPITLRGVVVLLSLSAFFLGAYINLYTQITGAPAARAIFLVLGLSVWNDLTHKLLPVRVGKIQRRRVGFIYAFGLITIILLFWTRTAFVDQPGRVLWMARMGIHPPDVIYGIFQLSASVSILYNFRLLARFGAGRQNRYFYAASLLAVSAIACGVLALILTPLIPKLIPDALILSSVSVLGISVARYQSLIERRATLRDFPISALAVFCLSAIYLFIAWHMGLSPIVMILVTGLAILTHSTYNLVREFLDRLRSKDESLFRQELRRLEANLDGNSSLQEGLQDGLELQCRILEASGAFVAVQHDAQYIVLASHHSIPVGKPIPLPENEFTDICRPSPAIAARVALLVPAFQGRDLVAVLGIGPPKSRLQYTEDDLDLLAEAADRIGIMIYLHGQKPLNRDRLEQMALVVQFHEADLQARSEELLNTLNTNPDPQFIKMVEDGLRNVTDFISLGQSALPEYLGASGETHIEKGKAVQKQLIQAIEVLRPTTGWPGDPIPREWYSYMVLHDAYREGIPNNEIMSKLYISEGTFHRTRRAAVRSVARFLLETRMQCQ